MKVLRFSMAALLATAVIVGCDDDDNGATGPTIDDLAGTWVASANASGTELVLTHNTSSTVINAIDDFGATAVLVVTTTEEFTFTITLPTGQVVASGDFQISGNNVTITTDEGSFSGTFQLTSNGDVLVLEVQNTTLIDINGDQVIDADDAAQLDATLNREE